MLGHLYFLARISLPLGVAFAQDHCLGDVCDADDPNGVSLMQLGLRGTDGRAHVGDLQPGNTSDNSSMPIHEPMMNNNYPSNDGNYLDNLTTAAPTNMTEFPADSAATPAAAPANSADPPKTAAKESPEGS
eukprot:gnl/MRDRNA2_/MRDRNA2_94969_c0_seq1.p1 gnl/MRDRNA2_/MRDRNA2_94969_c0~~gnl/MRDRNA2_/MRDRNA2_94969_c0_seq1.p1  ORF type:complete len:131 (+),score=28.55 gnl/MRDRNA2_/MRDRNA2_94969_c0_seq1:102-494(+)